MTEPVKTRTYSSPLRQARAAATRSRILDAAGQLFLARGYVATTAREIARAAGVSLDTVYAAVGRKPQLMLELVEQAISGENAAVPAEERDYVHRIREAGTAAEKITLYAATLRRLVPRLAPLVRVLREAAPTDPDCDALWRRISERRAANMLLFAHDLRVTGQLRPDLRDEDVADLVWSMNAPEYYLLLLERGWTPERYERLLVDVWTHTLLASPGTAG